MPPLSTTLTSPFFLSHPLPESSSQAFYLPVASKTGLETPGTSLSKDAEECLSRYSNAALTLGRVYQISCTASVFLLALVRNPSLARKLYRSTPFPISLDKRLGRRLNPLAESKFPPYPRDTCYISADTRCIFWVAVRIPSPRLLAPVNCQRYARYRIHGVVLSPATPSATANFFPLCGGGIFRGKPTIRLLSICWHVKGRWSSGVAEIQGKTGVWSLRGM